jgi:hypothetical protein
MTITWKQKAQAEARRPRDVGVKAALPPASESGPYSQHQEGRAESRDELAERTLDSAEAMVNKQLRWREDDRKSEGKLSVRNCSV